MSLRVWLPLVKDNLNQGLDDLQPTNLGTVSFINGGKLGKCLSAGTSTQTVNGISYPTNLVSELGTQFSCAIWVKPLGNHVHYNGTFVSSGNWNAKCWSFGVSQDNTKVDIFSKGYNRYLNCEVPVNTWTHLCCTSDNGTVKLYKNGVYVGQATGVPESLDSDATNFCVGRETYANGYFSFNGNINDLRIYDHALSPKEVKLLSQGLVCHYKLNRGSGDNILPDTSLCEVQYTYPETSYKDNFYRTTTEIPSASQYILSFYAKSTVSGDKVRAHFYNPNTTTKAVTNQGNTTTASDGRIDFTLSDKWEYYWVVWTQSSTTSVKHFIFPRMFSQASGGATGTGVVSVRGVKLEAGDTPTPWKPSKADSYYSYFEYDENVVYDSSGYNNHSTLNLSTSVSSDSPRNLVSTLFGAQNTPKSTFINTSLLSSLTNCTVCWWEKPITTANMLIFSNSNSSTKYIGAGSTSRDLYDSDIGTSGISFYRDGVLCTTTYSGNNVNHAGTKHTQNEWHHYALSGINLSSWTQFYINTYNSYPTQSYLSDVRLYATALSAADIQELYNAPVSIANTGTMLTQGEFVEGRR